MAPKSTASRAVFLGIDLITSGLGIDTLEGLDQMAAFDIYGDHIDYLTGSYLLTTSGIENLVGGKADDTFIFNGDAVLPGQLQQHRRARWHGIHWITAFTANASASTC